ncbi:copper chaperone [Gallaecimonas kandeliae]|uniref:heavy-metal-associated domain-containing protein n=1 Tax=Gallaecimonas kandeliae TaxID=3029055 RepID=UPI0026486AAB|nr:copper chaperone [Gallaecimonas kandeliae]WKE66192.1 copper chaperone [Gallaecimonas kandeliae]
MYHFQVRNILGDHCVSRIQQAVLTRDAEALLRVDRDHNQITIISDQSRQAFSQVLEDSGYPALN